MATVWRRMVGIVLVLAASTAWGESSPVITVQPRPQIVQTGQSATFSVTATGPETLSYQWRKDGVNLANGGRISWAATGPSSTLTINNVTANDVGQYDVLVSSSTYETIISWSARLALAGCVYGTGDNRFSQLGIGGPVPGVVLIGNVVKVAGGIYHALAIKNDGTVWAWGLNSSGQLGNGMTTDRSYPIQVLGLTSVADVAAGSHYNLAIRSDGTVWAWGANDYGQLGNGTTAGQASPVEVLGLRSVGAVAAGSYHSLAVKNDGTVWAWGRNNYGQLGNGMSANKTSPVQVPGLSGVTAVAVGGSHSLALKSDGTVWAWGRNDYGQLGNGTTTDQMSPIQVAGLTSVTAVAAGYWHSLALKSDGTVWAWGSNSDGQLGSGIIDYYQTSPIQVAGLTGVAVVVAHHWQSLALKGDGTVWTWGDNYYGQMGNGTMLLDQISPLQVPGLTDVTAVAAGYTHSLAVKADGTIWAWGGNTNGQMGDGTSGYDDYRTSPIRAPDMTNIAAVAASCRHNLAVKSDGTVWAWGDNSYGQLGNGTTVSETSPTQVPGLMGVATVATDGGDHGCHSLAVKDDGTVWAWGDNYNGQLGNGTRTCQYLPIQVPSLTGVAAVAAGYTYSLAVKSDGTVWAWGGQRVRPVGRWDGWIRP